ncbi:MAG: S41 family peptidase [Verrucomicrobiota bacterium]
MVFRLLIIALGLLPSGLVAAEDSSPAATNVDRLMRRVDLVTVHHVEAPSNQQMVLTLARAIYQARQEAPPLDLARQISKMNRTSDYRELLTTCLEASTNPSHASRFALQALRQSLPGDCIELPAKEYRVREQLAANQYVGIGIVLGKSGNIPTAMKVFPGGPLDRVGGRDGDQIWTIDGTDVRKEEISTIVDLLRGPRGTQLQVGLKHTGTSIVVEKKLTRDVVPLRGLRDAEILERTIAFLDVDHFQASITQELRALEPSLREKGVQALILDLRNLRPARVHDVILFADALLPGGEIGTLNGRVLKAGEDAMLKNLPLAVLVDQTTRGSLEWLAASLQQAKRAIVVGDVTPGEPWGYSGFEINGEESFLMLPSQQLGLPSGQLLVNFGSLTRLPRQIGRRSRERWGVAPDVWVGGEMLEKAMRTGFKADRVAVEQAKEALLEVLTRIPQ